MSHRLRFVTLLAFTAAVFTLAVGDRAASAQPDNDGEEEEANAGGDPEEGGKTRGGAADDSEGDTDKGAGDAQPDEKAEPETPTEKPADVDALRRRYLELRDKLFRSRARAATVASALYSTSLQIHLDYKSARHYTVTRATIRLDGANVFDDAKGKIADDKAVRFEGFVAPGRHRLTVRIEATGKDDDRFTSATESTFVVIAVADKDLVIKVRAEDDGDMAYKWQRKEKGNYRLGLDIDVESKKRKGQKKNKKSKKKKKAKRTRRGGAQRAAR